MILFGKKKIKLLKILLVSPIIEQVLLITYIICVPLLAFYPDRLLKYDRADILQDIHYLSGYGSFNKITNTSELYQWLNETLIPNVLTPYPTPYMVLGGLRLRQNRVNPQICIFKDGELTDACKEMVLNKLESMLSFKREDLSPEDCVYSQCQEFDYIANDQFSQKIKGEFGNYPMNGFKVYLDGRNMTTAQQQLSKLKKNGWLDDQTIAFVVEYNFYVAWTQCFVISKNLAEFNGGGQILARNFKYRIVFQISDSFYFLVIVLFFVQIITSALKLLLEISLVFNKFLFFGQIIHLFLQFFFVIMLLYRFSLNFSQTAIVLDSSSNFDILDNVASIDLYIKYLVFGIFIFYPFQIFQLMSWIRYLNPIIKFFASVYRTLPTISLYFLFVVIIVLVWGQAYFFFFQDYLYQFRNYSESILNLFFINLSQIDSNSKKLIEGSNNEIFNIMWFIQSLVSTLIVIFFVALLTDLFRRSAALEMRQMTPSEKETEEIMQQYQTKFEKFMKELSFHFNGKKENDANDEFNKMQAKILIWLDPNKGMFESEEEIISELKENNIKTMTFYETEEVIQFLSYLFRLKPNMLSSRAGERFRIVVEYKVEDMAEATNNFDILTDWLKFIGCRVPLLIFARTNSIKEEILHIKKKYPNIFLVNDIRDVREFCMMEGSIQNFYKYLQYNEKNKDRYYEETFSEEESFTSI